ncbi:unnamed protein product [Kuraishia capsulata CBS 1993]|uniref:5'-3' exoribonuclease 1 n=1 Tax=Kuraishia capsulata CBS 1993 TaxID=1382522 RepID=W6MNF8_9ASCO|nr:uncharacterized protein KUCA_T00004142001 [Kuraishia capsulata CBS 1993]CDK28161.1 unnamed protein product [Kuraishia capsulata CBS 1993]
MISQLIEENEIPEFDNLYLDMNSILHTCTHSNDDHLSSMSDEQMYSSIFAYIDHLFNTIQPRKVFYMAIDGVAPRAKMNQQRARRFRTALEAEEAMQKAVKEGLELPKEEPFDSNAITPGTEFMAKLTTNLKFYIHQKVSSDANWQGIEVILSGHEVPGEGEHKIMEYIRTLKSQPGYEANVRHCVYGLDADLIMLGLVTHEPHFALLREEVVFGPRKTVASSDLTKQNFYLLHLSLVREYLQLEFQDMEEQISFEYDFERMLDDFILIMFVVGNDFLPHLPDLHLNKGAFPLLIENFKNALRQTDGYLNEFGKINMKRLGVWLKILSKFEQENFEKVDVDVDWFNMKLENISLEGNKKRERMGKLLLVKQQRKFVGLIKPWILSVYANDLDVAALKEDPSKVPTLPLPSKFFGSELNMEFVRQFALDVGILIIHSKSAGQYVARLDIDGIAEDLDEDAITDLRKTIKRYETSVLVEDEETLEEEHDFYNDKFVAWRNKYYKEKLGFTLKDEVEMAEFTGNYVEGLQWVLSYYYEGVQSWPWYFKYHYAPRISDVAIGLEKKIEFNKGEPFTPFQQLMAVLPARSRFLIPACLRPLMTEETSPIHDFYPDKVDVDMNGKNASWEAVIKISFVDPDRLIEAMKPYLDKLSPEEKVRNSRGNNILFGFNPQLKKYYASPLPSAFADIEKDLCVESVFTLPSMEGLTYVHGLCPGAVVGKEALAGFPTLSTVAFRFNLKLANVLVFNQPSRSASMILAIENCHQGLTVSQFAQEYVGSIVYSNWPYLRESQVLYVQDEGFKYTKDTKGRLLTSPLENFEATEYDRNRKKLIETYQISKGVELPGKMVYEKIQGVVAVRPVNGLIRQPNGSFKKTFKDVVEYYPIPLIVDNVVNKDERYEEKDAVPIEEEYPKGSKVVFLGAFAYGTLATVIGHENNDKLTLKVSKISTDKEPNYGLQKAQLEKKTVQYFPSYEVARMLKISGLFLSKITSSYMIQLGSKKINVGLGLKFDSRMEKALGFTRKRERGWEYSAFAFNFLKEYMSKFPELFNNLKNIQGNKMPDAKDAFRLTDPDALKARVQEVTSYLKEKKAGLNIVSLDTESLTRLSMGEIERQIIDYVAQPHEVSTKAVRGIPRQAVLDAKTSFQLLARQRFELGDRVVYVLDTGNVPVFSKGTVLGYRSIATKVTIQVLFDEPIMTGNTFDGRLKTRRGMSVDSSALLNLTHANFVYHSKASAAKSQTQVKLTPEQKAVREAKRQQLKEQKEKAVADAKKKVESKKKGELLSLIKGNKETTDVSSEQPVTTPHAAQNIFGAVMGQVMGQSNQPVALPPINTLSLNNVVPATTPSSEGTRTSNRGRGRGGRGGRGRGKPTTV